MLNRYLGIVVVLTTTLLMGCFRFPVNLGHTALAEGATRVPFRDPRIRLIRNDKTGEYCTAFFVRPQFAFTAGHCIGVRQSLLDPCPVSMDGMKMGCTVLPVNAAAGYTEEVAVRDIGFLYFDKQLISTIHRHGVPANATFAPVPKLGNWSFRVAGFGRSDVRTKKTTLGYEPIRGDMVGIGGGRPMAVLTSCRASTMASTGDGSNSDNPLLRLNRAQLRGGACLPGPVDSGSPLLDDQGRLIGLALAIKYGPEGIDQAVYLKMQSKAYSDVLQQVVQEIRNAIFGNDN